MKKLILVLTTFIFLGIANAQEKEPSFGIKFSGFVKTDAMWDSRQTVTAREGHFLLWPAAESLDPDDEDVNAKLNFNMLAIQTRLKGTITGPDAFGAKTSGVIEGAFFGHSNTDVNGFRLRHAFLKLNWTNTELIIGQYWHPMFVTGCFPGTVSFNTGAPFQPFSRNPQIRITQGSGNVKFIVAAQSQRDFTSRGPNPVSHASTLVSSDFLRNSAIPDLHVQIHAGSENSEAGTEMLAGIGAGYKSLLPLLETSAGYKTTETVPGLSLLAFAKAKTSGFTVKAEAAYGENVADYLSLGGFAVKDTLDRAKGLVSYTPIKVMSAWIDMHTNASKVQVGLFAGYSKNLGAKDEINGPVWGLGTNIGQLFRVSPRIIYNSGKVRLAGEIEYTGAAYGSMDEMAIPQDLEHVANLRVLLAAYYFF